MYGKTYSAKPADIEKKWVLIDEESDIVGPVEMFDRYGTAQYWSGGIPLDAIGATGFGLAVCAEVAQEFAGVVLRGARVAIQGFGAVGTHAARFLAARGALLVAAADARAGTAFRMCRLACWG